MRKFFLLIATLGSLSLSNSASSAHSQITSTNPTQEATVEALPKKISITFSEEPLEIQGNEINTLTVYGPSNKIISASEIIINKKRSALH